MSKAIQQQSEREKQLVQALLECAGVYYDINLTQNKIVGRATQIVDGKEYDVIKKIGLPQNCPYSELMKYWIEHMPEEERSGFLNYVDANNLIQRYENGERVMSHKFWTYNVEGGMMLAEQTTRLYKEHEDGDLLGIVIITNSIEQYKLQLKEDALAQQYKAANDKLSALEAFAATIPAGYHRCGTEDGFPLQFISDSFLDVVGYTREELKDKFDNKFYELIAPEDRDFFMSHEPILREKGRVDLAYRMVRKDGTKRWIQDATKMLEHNGEIFYQCTLSDITEYVEKLKEETAKAEESNLAKSTFLFNASHDIRTPMNAIQGFAHIIDRNADNPEIVKEAIRKIIQSAGTLMTLLNDVLELSRIERGKDEVDALPMNMEHHVCELHEMFAGEMEQAGIEFVMDNNISHPHILGDNLKLTRIAMNLLSNSKKFTPSGGKVTFGVHESGFDGEKANYTLFVRDTGIGMSKQFQQRAFQQFERERSSTESGVSGSGLGLAIIKRLTDLMGGDCNITSELGKGSELTVTVPLKIADNNRFTENQQTQHLDFSGKRILLTEDNELNREIARFILEDNNLIVDEAENGSVCVDKLLKSEAGYYDLVLMDIQMPIMDGYTATKEIRNIADKRIADIPIIAMTANAFVEDKQKCLETGMNGHIGKPIDTQKLIKELARVFAEKE